MADAPKTMQVSLVAADREVWSGEATVVNAAPWPARSASWPTTRR